MDFLILIKNGCDNLTATVSPSIDSLGLRMVIALATIMLVWFGVQEALASAQGGPGFSLAKFIGFFVLITFAYCFVRFYDGAIPGIGYSLKGFISGGTSSLVDYIGNDSTQEVQNTIHNAVGKIGTLSPSFTEPYTPPVLLHCPDRSYGPYGIDRSHYRLRCDRRNRRWNPRPGFHPLDGIREDGLSLLGMAKGISRIRVLQSSCSGDAEHRESSAHLLSDKRRDEHSQCLVTHYPDACAVDALLHCGLRLVQNTDDDCHPRFRPCRRA
jgi:hypothetical protein